MSISFNMTLTHHTFSFPSMTSRKRESNPRSLFMTQDTLFRGSLGLTQLLPIGHFCHSFRAIGTNCVRSALQVSTQLGVF